MLAMPNFLLEVVDAVQSRIPKRAPTTFPVGAGIEGGVGRAVKAEQEERVGQRRRTDRGNPGGRRGGRECHVVATESFAATCPTAPAFTSTRSGYRGDDVYHNFIAGLTAREVNRRGSTCCWPGEYLRTAHPSRMGDPTEN